MTGEDRDYELSQELVDEFWRNGFIANVPVLSEKQCDLLLRDCNTLQVCWLDWLLAVGGWRSGSRRPNVAVGTEFLGNISRGVKFSLHFHGVSMMSILFPENFKFFPSFLQLF